MIFFFLIGHKIGVNTIIQEDIDGWLTTVSLNFLPIRFSKILSFNKPFYNRMVGIDSNYIKK